MSAVDQIRTPRPARAGGHAGHAHARGGAWRFTLHYLEMLAAMGVGMVVFGAIGWAVLGLAGLEFPDRYAELDALRMALYMSAGMVIWMRIRGHSWPANLEMAAVMVASAILLFPFLWTGVISGGDLVMAEHVLMLPLMLLAMLRRRAEYGC